MIKTYTTNPVSIDAVEYDGSVDNHIFLQGWSSGKVLAEKTGTSICIDTLEGVMVCSLGDFVIKGLRGEFYACKPDVFNQKYKQIMLHFEDEAMS